MKYFFLTLLLFFYLTGFSQQNIFDVARKGTVEEVKTIIKQNPEAINSANEDGHTPLILACYKGNNDVAYFLIKNVKDINGSSSRGTPLMAAVVKENKDIIRILLEHKANTDIPDQSGTTALMYATIFKNYDIVEMLIKASATLDLKDIRGNTALDYAKMTKDEKLIQLFKNDKL